MFTGIEEQFSFGLELAKSTQMPNTSLWLTCYSRRYAIKDVPLVVSFTSLMERARELIIKISWKFH